MDTFEKQLTHIICHTLRTKGVRIKRRALKYMCIDIEHRVTQWLTNARLLARSDGRPSTHICHQDFSRAQDLMHAPLTAPGFNDVIGDDGDEGTRHCANLMETTERRRNHLLLGAKKERVAGYQRDGRQARRCLLRGHF
jgi:hypothetical protein